MEKKKSINMAVCIICGVLIALGIVVNIISLVSGRNGVWLIKDVVDIILSCLIGYYIFRGYRKPNGNLLKYIILIFAVTYLIPIYGLAELGDRWIAVIDAGVIGLICYIAGRLHRVKQNLILMIIVTALIVLCFIIGIIAGTATIGIITPLIIWVDICIVYIYRYKEHKEAGLKDRAKE